MKGRKALLSEEELLVRDKVNKASERVSEKCEQTLHMQARTEPNTYDKHKHLSYSLRQGFCLSLLFIHLLTHCAVDDFPQQIGIDGLCVCNILLFSEPLCEHIQQLCAIPQEIDLSEALCGFHKVITTLDKRKLVITSHPGDVIKHGVFPTCK